MSKREKSQTQTPSENKRENLSKKLSDIRQTVALPVIGNVTIKVDTIEDIQPVTVNGKLKLRILFREGEDMKYALIGTIFIDQINECIKSGQELSIIRETDTLRTYVECH